MNIIITKDFIITLDFISCIIIIVGVVLAIAGCVLASASFDNTCHIFTVAGILIVIYGIMGFIPPTMETETYQVEGQVTYEKQEQNVYFIESNDNGIDVRKDFDTTSDMVMKYAESKDNTSYVKITMEKKLTNFNIPYVTKMVVYEPKQKNKETEGDE